jgi:ATP-dependent Clp protease protease subunit
MIHQPHGEAQDQASDIKISARRILRMREQLAEMLAKNSGQPLKKVQVDMDRDFFLEADDAVKYGIVDKILK